MTQSNRKFHTLAMLIGTTILEKIVWQNLAKWNLYAIQLRNSTSKYIYPKETCVCVLQASIRMLTAALFI